MINALYVFASKILNKYIYISFQEIFSMDEKTFYYVKLKILMVLHTAFRFANYPHKPNFKVL